MTPLETLQAARKLIEQPEHWTQGVSARDKKGAVTFICSRDAVSFCAIGATALACEGKSGPAYIEAVTALERAVGDDITIFNDTHTHAEILGIFDQAIGDLTTRQSNLPGR